MKTNEYYQFIEIDKVDLKALDDKQVYIIKIDNKHTGHNGYELRCRKVNELAEILLPVKINEVTDEDIMKEKNKLSSSMDNILQRVGFEIGAKWMRKRLLSTQPSPPIDDSDKHLVNLITNRKSGSDGEDAIKFAEWISELMKDSWFKFDQKFNTWYKHPKHLTTKELYQLYLNK